MKNEERMIFNIDDSLERFGGDKDLLNELASMFINEPQFSCEKLDNLLSKELITESASLVHQLKGISGTLGAELLYDQCIRFESIIKGKLEGNIPEEKDCLYAIREATIEQIQSYLEENNL